MNTRSKVRSCRHRWLRGCGLERRLAAGYSGIIPEAIAARWPKRRHAKTLWIWKGEQGPQTVLGMNPCRRIDAEAFWKVPSSVGRRPIGSRLCTPLTLGQYTQGALINDPPLVACHGLNEAAGVWAAELAA